MKVGRSDYLPVERAALIAVMLVKGRYLTTSDLIELFDCGMDAAKRDFERLSHVLPIDWRPYPDDARYKQWFWCGKEDHQPRTIERGFCWRAL